MQKKCCDLMVSNGPSAIDSPDNEVEVLDRNGSVLASLQGAKDRVASQLMAIIDARLIRSIKVCS
jgi:phosphopantothenoylcysteine decarboxylase/phosphopantothenate--cysteine ligase